MHVCIDVYRYIDICMCAIRTAGGHGTLGSIKLGDRLQIVGVAADQFDLSPLQICL